MMAHWLTVGLVVLGIGIAYFAGFLSGGFMTYTLSIEAISRARQRNNWKKPDRTFSKFMGLIFLGMLIVSGLLIMFAISLRGPS